jgi:23S rRNA (adenine2503-C2)-methyltransferase
LEEVVVATKMRVPMINLHDLAGMERLRRELRLDPIHLTRLRRAFYKKFLGRDAALAFVPDASRALISDRVKFHHLELVECRDSQIDGASKLLFRTDDNLQIETVILRVKSGRISLCVSSQVGCAADCGFCATGKLGLRRNLTSGEILDQIVQANEHLAAEGRRVRNIVFMGMGEPFHNEATLYETLDALEHKHYFHHSLGQVAVSTVGIPDAMRRCAERFPRVRLALSLHSAIEETRQKIIPLAHRYSLTALRDAVIATTAIQNQHVMVEYLMLAGLNDGAADLDALIEWATGLDVHLNLIPYNPISDAPELTRTRRPRREEFANALKARGFPVTLRYSLGADVTAACGQLVREENRRASRT